MRWGIKVVAALVCGALFAPVSAWAEAPANDDFADRQVVSGALPLEVPGSNVEATEESGEEVTLFAAGKSVWFEWVAPSDGWFTIDACNSDFAPVIGIFTGTEVDKLTRVVSGNAAEGPNCPFGQREYSFEASEGTHYVIGVDGNGFSFPEGPPPDDEGTFTLRIGATPPPPNDDFTDATAVTGSFAEENTFYGAEVFGYNWGATKEAEEPQHGGNFGGASVWYSWMAPASGTAAFYPCCGMEFLVGIYAGSSLGALVPVPVEAGPPGTAVKASVSAGTTYRIAIDGEQDESTSEPFQSSFAFRISMQNPELPGEPAPPDTKTPNPFETVPDVSSPETGIDRTKLLAASQSAKFWFSASEPVSGFLCRLDKAPFRPCGSPRAYRHLKPGSHVFKVKAVDLAGNRDPSAAVARFKIPKRQPRR